MSIKHTALLSITGVSWYLPKKSFNSHFCRNSKGNYWVRANSKIAQRKTFEH